MKDEIKKISERFNISEAEIRKLLASETDLKQNPPKNKKGDNIKRKSAEKNIAQIAKKENQSEDFDEFYFFTEKEYEALLKKMEKIETEIGRLGKEIGASCDDSETFHDNFDLEECMRQQHMWSDQLKKLRDIKGKIRILETNKVDIENVSIGNTVTVKNNFNEEIITIKIGGYMTIETDTISYQSPLAKILMGAKKGETRKGFINKKQKSYKVLKIEFYED